MEMENQILALLKQMNEKVEKLESRVGNIEARLDRHEELLQQIINMTAQNTEGITALRMETNQRFDKLELADHKVSTDINLLFKETQTNKRDIAN